MDWLISVGALLLSVSSFIFGRYISESQTILSEKRQVYREFLRKCPKPNDAYVSSPDDEHQKHSDFHELVPLMLMYAAPSVAIAVSEYLQGFEETAQKLTPSSPALDPAFKKLAKQHNDVILEIRRDAFSWSVYGYYGKSRLPEDALDRAKQNSL